MSKVKREKVRIRYDVYLSGPLSTYGNLEDNKQAMLVAGRKLRDKGLRVFVPPECEPEWWEWHEYLRSDLVYLVASKEIVVMPHWERSKGARLEVTVAKRLGMPVRTLKEVLDE